jgi:hypothetical protein
MRTCRFEMWITFAGASVPRSLSLLEPGLKIKTRG